jgi:hypothetical protein
MSFYPNPAKDIIYSKGVNQKPEKVAITDLYGRTIKINNFNYQNNELCINISSLIPGVYIIQLMYGNSEIKTGQIIVE